MGKSLCIGKHTRKCRKVRGCKTVHKKNGRTYCRKNRTSRSKITGEKTQTKKHSRKSSKSRRCKTGGVFYDLQAMKRKKKMERLAREQLAREQLAREQE